MYETQSLASNLEGRLLSVPVVAVGGVVRINGGKGVDQNAEQPTFETPTEKKKNCSRTPSHHP